MKHIQKYRSYLSLFMVIVILAIIGAYVASLMIMDFNWIIASLTVLIILLIIRIYTIATAFYSYIKELNQQQVAESQEEVTINDIINQEQTEEKEEKEKQAEELDRLINQLAEVKEPQPLAEKLLAKLGDELHIVQGLVYQFKSESKKFEVLSTFAYYGEEPPKSFELGEGLSGQAARDKKHIILRDLPEDYTEVISGLGKRKPILILLAPIINNDKTVALVELAFFEELSDQKIEKFQRILNKLAEHFA